MSLRGRVFVRRRARHVENVNNKPMRVKKDHQATGMLKMSDGEWWTRSELAAAGWYLKKRGT